MHPLEHRQGWGQLLYSHLEVSGAIRGRCLGSAARHTGPPVSHGCCRVVGKDWLAQRKGATGQRSGFSLCGFCPHPLQHSQRRCWALASRALSSTWAFSHFPSVLSRSQSCLFLLFQSFSSRPSIVIHPAYCFKQA